VGHQLSSLDANSVGWTATYDSLGRLLTRSDTRPVTPGTTGWGYDLDGNRVSETDPSGKTEVYAYDLRNRRVLLTDRLGGKTRFGYDAVGNLTQISDADNEAAGGLMNPAGTTQYAYDDRNLLIAEAFPNGQQGRTLRTYGYDAGRRLTGRSVGILSGVFSATPTFAAGPEATTYAYDNANRLITRGYADARNDGFTYDPVGRLLTATSARYGNTVTRAYDAVSRLLSETLSIQAGSAVGTTSVAPVSYQVQYGYDADNRTTTLTYPDGSVVTRGYSDRNELASVAYGGSTVATRSYDAGGRLATTTFGNGLTETRSYIDGDNLVATMSTSSGSGPVASGFSYTYDQDRRKLTETDLQNGSNSQTFAYDDAGRLTSWHQGVATQSWNLSLVGDWNSTTRNGVTESRTNTRVHEAVQVGSATLGYDAKGNLTTDEQGQQYVWDPENRLLGASNLSNTVRGTAAYAYDALGRRVSKYVDGRRTDFALAGAQVVQEYDHYAPAAPADVASDGAITALSATPQHGILTAPSSGSGGQLIRINFQPANEQIPTGYLADKGRPLTTRTNGLTYGWSADASADARVRHMVDDAAFDTHIALATKTWAISLPNGTYPVAIVAGDAANTDSTNNLVVNGQALTDPDPATSTPSYSQGDFDGWIIPVTVTDGTLTVTAGSGAVAPKLCLIEIGVAGQSIDTASQTRLTDAVANQTTQTAGNGFPPVEPTPRSFVYGTYVDEVLAYQVAQGAVATRYYPHYNHLYSVAALTNSSGAVVERYTYDAYGKHAITSDGNARLAKSAIGWDRGFTGYTIDRESGLLFARMRMFLPQSGRFASRDPIQYNGGGYGLYASYFVPNTNDPTGLAPACDYAGKAALEAQGWVCGDCGPDTSYYTHCTKPCEGGSGAGPSNGEGNNEGGGGALGIGVDYCTRSLEFWPLPGGPRHAYLKIGDWTAGFGPAPGVGAEALLKPVAGQLYEPERIPNGACNAATQRMFGRMLGTDTACANATPAQIQDCIKARAQKDKGIQLIYYLYGYNCQTWAKETLRDCCAEPPQ
jgi:RHS repeat-associated protein